MAALALAVGLLGCKSEVKHTQDCTTLQTGEEREVCEEFADAFDTYVERDDEPTHTVLRSFCGEREHREAVGAESATDGVAQAVGKLWRERAPGDECALALEVLTPAMERTRWAAVNTFDQYRATREALVIHDEPTEVVTPLDFSTVRPRASLHSLERLPHLYPRQARNRHYLAEETLVQPHLVDAFVLRDEGVEPIRYHRVRHASPDTDALESGIRRAAQSLDEMRYEEAGRLYYEYDPYRDRYEKHDYNLLRHAGTTWSVMQAYGLTGDRRFRELGEYALDWLVEQSETDERDGRTIRYAVESWNDKAKLGGAGLWLLALAEHARITGDEVHHDLMQEIANHIYLSQDPESGKFETFYDGEGLRVTDHESDYYPGEAMFALHRAAPFIEDIPVCEVSRKGLAHMLEDEPRRMPTEEYRFVNQWNVYTIREYRRDCDDDRFDWLWEREIDHMLQTAATAEEAPVMAGAYIDEEGDPNTSPTRLEALTVI
ncbi:MAG: hypothetical protein ACOCV2_10375, partial [Persicimonas sp.]